MATTLIDALKVIAELKRLSLLVSTDEQGQEARWQALQAWLADHPTYRATLCRCLKLAPAEAVQHLCREFDLEIDTIKTFDPNGSLLAMTERTIAQLQNLYTERARIEAQERIQ